MHLDLIFVRFRTRQTSLASFCLRSFYAVSAYLLRHGVEVICAESGIPVLDLERRAVLVSMKWCGFAIGTVFRGKEKSTDEMEP
jgi:hypothetical protein